MGVFLKESGIQVVTIESGNIYGAGVKQVMHCCTLNFGSACSMGSEASRILGMNRTNDEQKRLNAWDI
jgi:hypothetical protein